jgi:DNA-binding response OmpR family regulator
MTQPKILLVDDDSDVRFLVRVLLSTETIEVIEADSGSAALDSLERNEVDGVVLDWMMPGVSGLDVLRRVRGNPELDDVPIIMLTAMSEDKLIDAVDAGADWIVRKPFEVEALLEAVTTLCPAS